MRITLPRNYTQEFPTYLVILENSTSKERTYAFWVKNESTSPMYYTFEVPQPSGMQRGQFTAYVAPMPFNGAVSVEESPEILRTLIVGEGKQGVQLRDLRYEVSLVATADMGDANAYYGGENQTQARYYEG